MVFYRIIYGSRALNVRQKIISSLVHMYDLEICNIEGSGTKSYIVHFVVGTDRIKYKPVTMHRNILHMLREWPYPPAGKKPI